MIAVFSDAATVRHALIFEGALARAQVAERLITPEVALAIAAACEALDIDSGELAEEAALAGTLAIPLVKRLRADLPEDAARAVHLGATSQDLADTVLIIQAKEATALLMGDVQRVCAALFALADRHGCKPAVGRTLMQDALPIGFGLRLAQAAAGIADAAERLGAEVAAHSVIELGGAAGTRAGLNGKGAQVAARMAAELGLGESPPWHARRVGIAAIAAALGILVGALGKFARDIALLAQNGIDEAREPQVAGRGGSSAMAHKRNPTGCQVALSAAIRAPGLVAAVLAGLPQEEERGLGGWQAEGPALTELFLLAAGSAAALAAVAEGLEINEAAIDANLKRSGLGNDVGESVAIVAALRDRYAKDKP